MSVMQAMMQRGLSVVSAMQAKRGRRGMFFRMCQCGQEFYAIGRGRKVSRRLASEHIERCRQKSIAARAEGVQR
jgi:hypothetical protein